MIREAIGRIEFSSLDSKRGVGFILEEGCPGTYWVFKFGVIEGYKGEFPRELKRFSKSGLHSGILVKFVTRDNRVASVKPLYFAYCRKCAGRDGGAYDRRCGCGGVCQRVHKYCSNCGYEKGLCISCGKHI